MKHGYWNSISEAKRLLDLDNVPENGRLIYMSQDVYKAIAEEVGIVGGRPVSRMLGMNINIFNKSDERKGYIQMVWEGGSTYD